MEERLYSSGEGDNGRFGRMLECRGTNYTPSRFAGLFPVDVGEGSLKMWF